MSTQDQDARCKRELLLERQPTPQDLHAWIQEFVEISVPRQAVCPHHCAPFDYIWRAYHEPATDLIVWAPRGGGKTRLAAVATLLDLLHKPGCSVRILGGSLEQSLRLWEHLLPEVEKHAEDLIVRKPRSSKRITLSNGSSAAVLTQSERAVRGLRVQKLRCDEVEMFQPEIWEAAQLVTRSKECDGLGVRGTIEAISTYHSTSGLMSRIVGHAQSVGIPVLRWCLLEVLEKCPAERDCATCPLWEDCRGIAKTRCEGFVSIDDAIAMKYRVSRETWDAEVLCKRPNVHGCVFPSFNVELHVRQPLSDLPGDSISLAIDFGFHNPFVCLWIADDGTNCHVIDEYVQSYRTIADHIEQIESRPYGKARRICCDPAGAGRNDQTAESNVEFLKRHGYKVHTKHSRIVNGIELIRTALRPAYGNQTLFIHPRCKRLIAALQQFRYPEGGSELPHKDGTHDHLVDALRYFYVNRSKIVIEPTRRY